ncbi:MAG: DUF805 domain-containing protein [Clostridia bacterium]|nr:DUF805 domain-containing protein [Clostridia bacterium]
MIDAFKKMIENWKDFEGKTNRPDYWWATLAVCIVEFIVSIIITVVFAVAFGKDSVLLGIIGVILTLAVGILGIFIAIAGISMSIRRLRDAGFPWWFYLANFIPSVGNIAVIVMLCFPSSEQPIVNFGSDAPKAAEPAEAPKPAPAPVAPVVDVEPEEAPVVEEAPVEAPADDTWTCASCGNEGNTGKFCGSCGAAKPE